MVLVCNCLGTLFLMLLQKFLSPQLLFFLGVVAIRGFIGIQVCRHYSFDLQQPKLLVEEEREEPGCLLVTTPYRDVSLSNRLGLSEATPVSKGCLLCVAGVVDTPDTRTSQMKIGLL